jgi:hypothetical protein
MRRLSHHIGFETSSTRRSLTLHQRLSSNYAKIFEFCGWQWTGRVTAYHLRKIRTQLFRCTQFRRVSCELAFAGSTLAICVNHWRDPPLYSNPLKLTLKQAFRRLVHPTRSFAFRLLHLADFGVDPLVYLRCLVSQGP